MKVDSKVHLQKKVAEYELYELSYKKPNPRKKKTRKQITKMKPTNVLFIQQQR